MGSVSRKGAKRDLEVVRDLATVNKVNCASSVLDRAHMSQGYLSNKHFQPTKPPKTSQPDAKRHTFMLFYRA